MPSWNDGAAKQAVLGFVRRSVEPGPGFVEPAERIATFDNDGTLWSEQPIYFQLAFAIDRVVALAPQHPEWKAKEPFRSLLRGDVRAALAGGQKAAVEILAATHRGSPVGKLDEALRAARAQAWLVVDMKRDWKRIYPFEPAAGRKENKGEAHAEQR